ncbi:NADH-quinone oxidoreductase subunit J [Actinoalloteichus hymeniacidonis]|uniref:NADH-quinone oxidoreductase subunit J n=1 Tax=Actinoalloteichus hymeniacidonis TaxID=340345 RepID=A0AAC9HLL6_9PSEU|nr:NADH dehydrogenase subunit J [Actinoalloteichus hymeniacidonis]MBB5910627.1 NADH-quinone oxidoreductase subunit J [Actinoalloteichus hymeniacidonis]
MSIDVLTTLRSSVLAAVPAPQPGSEPVADVIGTGEAIAFWILGPAALLGALGMIFARNAVHSALWLVMTMLSLGVMYMVQQAPFLGIVQIIVYTGAIMMLFLFVLMLVGRDSADSVVEVLRGQRLLAALFGIGFGILAVGALVRSLDAVDSVGLDQVNGAPGGNVGAIGESLFTDYLWPFELTGALLVVATVGALVFVLVDKRDKVKLTQRERVEARFRGELSRPSPLPGPGVFATANSVATPALLPDGSVAPESLSDLIESTALERLDAETASVSGSVPGPGARELTGDDGSVAAQEDSDATTTSEKASDADSVESKRSAASDAAEATDTSSEEGRA